MCLFLPKLHNRSEIEAFKIVRKNKDGKYESIFLHVKPTVFEKVQSQVLTQENYYDPSCCYHAELSFDQLKDWFLQIISDSWPISYGSDLLMVKVKLFGTIFYDDFDSEVAGTGIEFLEEIS